MSMSTVLNLTSVLLFDLSGRCRRKAYLLSETFYGSELIHTALSPGVIVLISGDMNKRRC